MNSQREVIYTKRRHALLGERLSLDINNMMFDMCESIVLDNHGVVDYSEFSVEILRYLSVEPPVDETEYKELDAAEVTERLYNSVKEAYLRKHQVMVQQAWPVIKDVFEKQGKVYENIVVPVSDGSRVFQVLANLEKCYASKGKELVRSYEKSIILATIDQLWQEHLRELDDLRQSVRNAQYEQKDPLLIYKFEAFELFTAMIDKVNRDVVSTLMKAHIPLRDPSSVKRAVAPKKMDLSKFEANKDDMTSYNDPSGGGRAKDGRSQAQQPVRVEKKVGRNEPCPCGSGKKYKNCHGKPGGA